MEKNKLNINTKIVAEIANAHQGSMLNAINLANKCIVSGADAVKFQVYSAKELLHASHKRYNHFKKQSFNLSQWNDIFKKIKKKKSKIFCDVFGEESFAIANNNKVDGFKIHSSDLINKNLIDLVSKVKQKEIFLSTGGSTLREISYAVSFFKKNNIKPVLLHGYQSYPTLVGDTNLNRIDLFKSIFKDNCKYGYQDHISGDNEMSSIIPFISMSLGLDFIEKHVTLDRSKKGVDYYSSLEPKELKNFINKINIIKSSFGNHLFTFSKQEKKYRNDVKKIWFVKQDINKKKIIKNIHLIMKRPSKKGIAPVFIENLVNSKATQKMKKEETITNSKININITAVIVARSKSKRLPNKALKLISNETIIEHLLKRLRLSKKVKNIVLATTRNKEDLKICKIAKMSGVSVFRGEEKNVLKRMFNASKKFKSDLVIRVTGDDVLIDPEYLDKLIDFHLNKNLEYSNNKALPGGTEVEIFNKDLISFLLKVIKNKDGTEYLTFYIQKYKDQFNCGSLNIPSKHRSDDSLTIDTLNDFLFVKNFLVKMKNVNKRYDYKMDDIIGYLKKNKKKSSGNQLKKKININTDFEWKKITN